ncbi:hypothetical protein SEA_WEASELS2_192 [Rhodococcus phage Weasels2]|uniref:DUF7455 domain-containing protein n=1 Tax=Rhodococcus phage Weasels2 TaxID=1897437 RepID=A0A1I9SAG4_9CAUD|nr:hypothetical protein FDH04_gp224 [Rhodococcus phage Weasels2]AOZ63770.1 hypothetical protein SEA_WEASELS2_192 [Rhodococcus phage Weasels2]
MSIETQEVSFNEEAVIDFDWSAAGRKACDVCQHRAYVRTYKDQSVLFFCGHHYRHHELALVSGAWNIDDQTAKLRKEVEDMKKPSGDTF